MSITPELPENIIELIGVGVIAVTTMATVWITNRVRHQVENTHQTNLRDDLDEVRKCVRATAQSLKLLTEQMNNVHDHITRQGADIRGLRGDVGSLRVELQQERDQRARDVAELRRRAS